MDTEIIFRVAAIAVAVYLCFSIDYSPVIKFVTDLFKRKTPTVTPTDVESVEFLDIVESWHVLRNQCESYGLHDAVAKVDEVFPLLNGGDEDA